MVEIIDIAYALMVFIILFSVSATCVVAMIIWFKSDRHIPLIDVSKVDKRAKRDNIT